MRSLVSGARGKTVYETGDVDAGVWSAGISIGLIKEIKTCKQLLADMEAEAEATIRSISALVVPATTPAGASAAPSTVPLTAAPLPSKL